MALPKHGSNPKYLYNQLNLKEPNQLIDFSVNLNPLGPPESIFKNWKNWQNEIIDYPDPLGKNLKKRLAQKENIDSENILLGNGAAELIQLVAIYFQKQKVGLFQPTFSEYERMTSAYGAQINYLSLKYIRNADYIKRITKEQDAIFLCHPNNPTGEIYEESILENILGYCKKNNCYLILDEAFYDFSDEVYSMAQKVHYSDHLIILRSVTKMFSIAGIRLGYLFAGKELIKQLRAFQPYWSVNALALKIGELVVNEDEFVEESQKYIKRLRGEIFPEIKELGFLLSNSKVNFFLLRDPILDNQKDLLIFLLKKGIVPRHTENYPFLEGKYLRFAIRPDNEMQELLEVLKEWKNN